MFIAATVLMQSTIPFKIMAFASILFGTFALQRHYYSKSENKPGFLELLSYLFLPVAILAFLKASNFPSELAATSLSVANMAFMGVFTLLLAGNVSNAAAVYKNGEGKMSLRELTDS